MEVFSNRTSKRSVAITAGVALLVMAVAAGFAYGFVINKLIIADDITKTVKNIKNDPFLFRAGMAGFLIVLITDVIVAWALYLFFEPVNKALSLLTAWFRIVYTAMLGAALIPLAIVLFMLHAPESSTGGIGHALVLPLVDAFLFEWAIALALFGLHLVLLGILVVKSNAIPTVFGIIVIVGGAVYFCDNLAVILVHNYEEYRAGIEGALAIPLAVAELALAVWLLVRGGKEPAKTSRPHR